MRRARFVAAVLALLASAGAAHAHFIGFVAPDNYVPILTFQVWAMLIVGGSGNNRGAILGAVLVWGVWTASAAVFQSMRPSSGLRPPKYEPCARSCLVRGALSAISNGRLRCRTISAASVTLRNTSTAVSSGRIGTACWSTFR